MPTFTMTIKPVLTLDENDLKPFINEFRKVMKIKDDAVFQITSIVPLALPTGWTLEIKGEFVNHVAEKR